MKADSKLPYAATPAERARDRVFAQFPDPVQRRQHFRELAERSASRRRGGLSLSADDSALLSDPGVIDVLRALVETLEALGERRRS